MVSYPQLTFAYHYTVEFNPMTGMISAMTYDHENQTTIESGADGIFTVDPGMVYVYDPNPSYGPHNEFFVGYTNNYDVLTFCYDLYYLHTNTPWAPAQQPIFVNQLNLDITALPCFLIGTRIETDRGLVAVEDLVAGDLVRSLSGEMKPLRWVGRRAVSGDFAARHPAKSLPVCLSAGALGEALPLRDLWLSPEHCLHHAGALIPARSLVNGTSVVQRHPARELVYFHLLLDVHDVIFAEGVESETYRPANNLFGFQNRESFPADISRDQSDKSACFPVKFKGAQIEALRARLAQTVVASAAA